jgi:hypothetical protein
MSIMGWSSTGMAHRYQHVTDPIRDRIAKQVDNLLWESGEQAEHPPEQSN